MSKITINKRVYIENIKIYKKNLVIQNLGNVSLRSGNICLIKPSGINFQDLKENQIVKTDISCGKHNGVLAPSTDTPTHLEIYRKYSVVGGVAHTHSKYATAWAQAAKPIPCLGTTHADYWRSEIPVTRLMTKEEINGEYEVETGKVIVETLEKLELDPLDCPGILVAHHGPFTWGATVEDAVKHAEMLEYVAKLAWLTLQLNTNSEPISQTLHERHFSRKHGPKAYYGQANS